MTSSAVEDVGPGVATVEEGRVGDEVADGDLIVFKVTRLVFDVECPLLLTLGVDLLQIMLVESCGVTLFAVSLVLVRRPLHCCCYLLDELRQSRVELCKEGHFGELVLIDV